MKNYREKYAKHLGEVDHAFQTKMDMLEKQKNKLVQEFTADLAKQRQSYREESARFEADIDDIFKMSQRNFDAEKRSLDEMRMRMKTAVERGLGKDLNDLRANEELPKSIKKIIMWNYVNLNNTI